MTSQAVSDHLIAFKQILVIKAPPPKVKLYSVIAFKRYLNEKNLAHGREIATISKFSAQVFETYFSLTHSQPTLKRVLLLLYKLMYQICSQNEKVAVHQCAHGQLRD